MARGRKASHRISQPHPHKRYAGVIKMLNYRRGPTDDIWGATFKIDGKWTPRDGVSLGTRDWDDAVEFAREKYTLLVNGHQIVRPRAAAAPPAPDDDFAIFAAQAILRLRQQAKSADKIAKGKGHTFRDKARRIEQDLWPKWRGVSIKAMDEHAVNDWISIEYRVEDVEATVKAYGRQARDENRKVIYKKPGMTTLGNLDNCLKEVWDEAVDAHVVGRRARPIIDKVKFGEEGEPRAFIDDAGVTAVAKVMTNTWVNTPDGHGTDMKRMLRTYVAMIACTGIRAGLEAKRVRLGDVHFVTQHGKQVILIRVMRFQGKHREPRSVVVFEGNPAIPVRRLLADHIGWRESQGASKVDYLFAWPDGTFPTVRNALDTVLREAGVLIDPMTGEKRVAYSFRHYFATLQIERGLSVPQIAEWLGTSSAMVEKHYNRFLVERRAHLLNGAPDEQTSYVDEHGVPWHWDADADEHGEWVPG